MKSILNKKSDEEGYMEKSVLFVMVFKNDKGFKGYGLTDPQYSPYPYEEDHIFKEGATMKVVGTEEKVIISNSHENCK